MKNFLRYPIIPIAFFYVNGIFFSNHLIQFLNYKLTLFFALFCFLLFIVSHFLINKFQSSFFIRTTNALSALFFFFLIGIVSLQFYKTPNNLELEVDHFGVITIDEVLKSNDFQNRYFAKIKTSEAIEQKILVYQNKSEQRLQVGDQLSDAFFIKAISNTKNPIQFDYSKYLENKNIFIQTNLSDNYLVLEPSNNFKYRIMYLRSKLMDSFKIHEFSNDVNGVVYALLFGQRNDLSEKIQNDFRNAGVMHVLAISGMHIGILYWIIDLFLKLLIRRKTARFVMVIIILSFFAVLSGLSGSVVRSVVMFFIVGSGLIFFRRTDTVNVLALSMFLILIVNPSYLFDIGFQLSYLAVFSIVYLFPFVRRFFTSKNIILKYFLELVGISLVAQIGILPLTIFYFGQIPLLFLIGNIIVIPLITLVLIGLVFVLILNFIWEDFALILGKILEVVILFINESISIIASKNDFILSNIKLNFIQCILFLCLIFLIAYTFKKYSYRKLIAVFVLIIGLQASYLYESVRMRSVNDFMMLYDYNSTTFLNIKNKHLNILSSDSLIETKKMIHEINKEYEIENKNINFISNYFEFNNSKVLIVDSLGIVDIPLAIDVLILKDNAKFNLDRYLQNNQPKIIIIHPKNYNYVVGKWEETCLKNKIPFHNMREKGFVDFSNYDL